MNRPPAIATNGPPPSAARNTTSTTSAFLNRLSFSAPNAWVRNRGRKRRVRRRGGLLPPGEHETPAEWGARGPPASPPVLLRRGGGPRVGVRAPRRGRRRGGGLRGRGPVG